MAPLLLANRVGPATLLFPVSPLLYAVVRRRSSRRRCNTVCQEAEHSPLTTEEENESDGIAATGDDEADGSASESDERDSVSERNALTGLV
eukprot:COSAG02_NODE_312_length_24941_cov_60.672611_9_plen_91_part_00